MTTPTRLPRPVLVLAGAALTLLGACGSSGSDATAPAPSTSSTTSPSRPVATVPRTTTTTAAAATSSVPAAAPTTTVASGSVTSSTAPGPAPSSAAPSTTVPDPLGLHVDGVGAFHFGQPLGEVTAGITAVAGADIGDDVVDFPTADPSGGFTDDSDERSFVAPIARTVCWSGSLCLTFGGTDPTALTFTGWRLDGETGTTAPYATATGIGLGSRWSDHQRDMSVQAGGCYTIGGGTTVDGVTLVLQGGVFGQTTDDGGYVSLLPAPSEVTVVELSAGATVTSFDDC